MVTIPTVSLNDGIAFPQLGFGTYKLTGDDGIAAIGAAIETGYRLLDTAVNYGNEGEVGEAVRRSGIRDELIVTTKVPGREHGYEEGSTRRTRRSTASASTASTCTSSTGRTRRWASGSTHGAR